MSIGMISTYIFSFFIFLYPTNGGKSTINSISYGGSGCPAGSVSTSKDSDSTTLAQEFDDFTLYWGPGTTPADRLKSCVVNIEFGFDEPCTQLAVNVQGIDATGFVSQMNENMTVSATVTYMRGDGVDAVVSPFSSILVP